VFEGIAFREFLRFVELDSDVKYVKIYGYLNQDRFGYSANLPLEVPMGDDALFGYRWKDKHRDWQDIPQNMAIRSALWKGAKWASEIRFMKKDEPGYWEQRGYSMNSNPFKEERFADR
jgi:DMSO/TMAO reductase YedYZ molybdopterin-dependent catalytic subunit